MKRVLTLPMSKIIIIGEAFGGTLGNSNSFSKLYLSLLMLFVCRKYDILANGSPPIITIFITLSMKWASEESLPKEILAESLGKKV